MSQSLSRRDLGRLLGPALAGAAVACSPEVSTRFWVTSLAEVEAGSVTFEYPPGHKACVVKLGQSAEGGVGADADIVVVHHESPHMGCPLSPGGDSLTKGELGPCGCHQSRFDLRGSGRQIEGRASQGLVQVLLQIEDGEIYATEIEGTPFGEAPNA